MPTVVSPSLAETSGIFIFTEVEGELARCTSQVTGRNGSCYEAGCFRWSPMHRSIFLEAQILYSLSCTHPFFVHRSISFPLWHRVRSPLLPLLHPDCKTTVVHAVRLRQDYHFPDTFSKLDVEWVAAQLPRCNLSQRVQQQG